MPIKFRCVHCGQYLGISHSKAGTVVDCPTCGRSVGVPMQDGQAERVGRPSLDHEDSELANALREVAAIAQSSEVALPHPPPATSRPADARETREVHAPPPTVVPAEPLAPAKPIEPQPAAAAGGFIRPESIPDESHEDEEETYYERVPFKSLESLAADESRPEPERKKKPAPTPQPSQPQLAWTNEVPWKLWLAVIAFGFVSLLAGFALGRWDQSQEEPQEPAAEKKESVKAEPSSARPKPAADNSHADLLAKFGKVAFLGTATYADAGGAAVKKDAGAWVYAFPVKRTSGEKIPAAWLQATNPEDYGSGHVLAVAALRGMGGNAVQADANGEFRLHLPNPGPYRLLVCSAVLTKDPGDPAPAEVVEMLSGFVEDPAAFLDHRLTVSIASIECGQEETPISLDPITP